METAGRFCVLCFLAIVLLKSCVDVQDTFRSTELISSQGEKIYINTLSWGMTDDNQYTILSKNRDRLKHRQDTIDGVKGLTPFVYKFSHDTLYIFLQKGKTIDVKEELQSIQLNFTVLENREYMDLLNIAIKGEDGYRLIR